jgi:L-fuconolactonase
VSPQPAAATTTPASAAASTTPITDAHHHLWDPATRNYPWLAGERLAPLRRPYTVDDLRSVTERKVARTILVQTLGDRAETAEFLATAAASAGLIAGVVGWVDLEDSDVDGQLARLRDAAGGHLLVGIRHQVQDEPDPRWLLRPAVLRGIGAVGAAGLAYDLLVRAPQLPMAREAAIRLPEVRFVLDHLAKPDIASRQWQPWADELAELADQPNVTAKLSGLVTEADWHAWDGESIGRYARHALAVFGPRRCMFGSDWPVCTVAASYADVLDLVWQAVAGLDEAQRLEVFSGTAARVYGLSDVGG